MARLMIVATLLTLCWVACAADAPAGKTVVAVLPCQSDSPEVAELSKSFATLLSASLTQTDKFDLVEREHLDKVLKEQELALSGLVDGDQAVKIGKLVGARILVQSSAFVLDKQIFLVAKIINAETGRVKAAKRATPANKPVASELVDGITEDVNRFLAGDTSVPAKDKDDRVRELVSSLVQGLGNDPRPSVTIVVPEDHIRARTPDPAVQTELSYILRKLRFTVVENDSDDLAKWAKNAFEGHAGKFPKDVGDVNVVIFGGAFSEDAGAYGDLRSSRARLELTALNTSTGEVLAVNRATASAADTSASTAAKTALENATLKLAKEFISDLQTQWTASKKK